MGVVDINTLLSTYTHYSYVHNVTYHAQGLCSFLLPCRMKPLSLAVPGSYRKLLSYPKNLSWKILPRVPLSHDQHVTSPPKSDSVFFKVTLDTSCYATVFLREIMKQKKCQW